MNWSLFMTFFFKNSEKCIHPALAIEEDDQPQDLKAKSELEVCFIYKKRIAWAWFFWNNIFFALYFWMLQLILEFWLNARRILMPPFNFSFSDRNFVDGTRIPFKNTSTISLEFWLEKLLALLPWNFEKKIACAWFNIFCMKCILYNGKKLFWNCKLAV